MSKIERSKQILREDGLPSLIRRGSRYLYESIRWQVQKEHILSLDGMSAKCSVDGRTSVKRDRKRFFSEKNILTDLLDELKYDDVFYDIGANTGIYTIFAAKRSISGQVIAFEPYPPNIEILQSNIAENRLKNVEVVDTALSDFEGQVRFKQPETDDVGYGFASIEPNRSSEVFNIPTTTGDQLVADGEIPVPDVIKIDVEGAESLVVDGLNEVLSRQNCRLVYCEIHPPTDADRPSIEDFDSSEEQLISEFNKLGFSEQLLEKRGDELMYKLIKSD